MDLGLKGRKALVTGGAAGIGAAIALELAREGCDVAIVDVRRDEKAELTLAAVAGAGVRATFHTADVRDFSLAEQTVREVAGAAGHLDVRFIPPWNPLPKEVPVTSTKSPAAKASTLISSPTLYSLAASFTSSLMSLRGAIFNFLNIPAMGLVSCFSLASSNPTRIFFAPTAKTGQGPASMTVTPTRLPSSVNIWVIPIFLPNIPVIAFFR